MAKYNPNNVIVNKLLSMLPHTISFLYITEDVSIYYVYIISIVFSDLKIGLQHVTNIFDITLKLIHCIISIYCYPLQSAW